MNKVSIKKIIIPLLTMFFIGMITVALYVYNDRQFINYTPHHSDPPTLMDITAIGLVGDSWVAGEKLDSAIEDSLASKGIALDIISYGYPGYRSSQILQELSNGDALELLNNQNIRSIIVIAGVNDSAGRLGQDYYAHHMTEIVKLINSYNKTPIIVELPEYGIEEPKPFKSSVKHNLYKVLFDAGNTNVIQKYRDTLDEKLKSTSLTYKIIPTNKLLFNYHKQINLYGDPYHLNESGRKLLSQHIAAHISQRKVTEGF